MSNDTLSLQNGGLSLENNPGSPRPEGPTPGNSRPGGPSFDGPQAGGPGISSPLGQALGPDAPSDAPSDAPPNAHPAAPSGPNSRPNSRPDARPDSRPDARLNARPDVWPTDEAAENKWSGAAEKLDMQGASGVPPRSLSGAGSGASPGSAPGSPPGSAPGSPHGAASGAASGVSGGGAWLWLPQGPGPKPPWRKRHPVLFWGAALLLLSLVFSWGRMSVEDGPLRGPKIAVINVEGMILDAGPVVAWMEKIRQDGNFKGAVLRINSPGGAVGPSQEIYEAAKRLAAAKPLVASMGALAASGGYYAALGADHIVAGPSTLTASIGVKMQLPNVGRLMRTLGLSETTLTTGDLKDAGNVWRDMKPEEEAYFRALIDDMYQEFLETVAREREMPLEAVRALADGRAMTGRQALKAGLVDELGDLHKAAQTVRMRAGLEAGEARLEEGPPRPSSWLGELLGASLNTALDAVRDRRAASETLFFY